ncbi:alkaline phosphatase family protein [Scleromatobacter humisilvae]|uniref:alkaline phosphatase family protein n=1 Tax=Scleromatobacter humisilvae TaxID=2897159 RepID=UPI00308400B1
MNSNIAQRRVLHILTPVSLACALVACGGDSNSGSTPPPVQNTTYTGKVVATSATADVSGNPKLASGYYKGATVFIDTNGNGVLDAGEPSATTDATGSFSLTAPTTTAGQFVADIPTTATNTATSAAVPAHLILRASAAQVTAQGATKIVISPLSTEVQRLVEANGTAYATEVDAVAKRLTGPAFNKGSATVSDADVVADPSSITNAPEQYALQYESNSLANRYTYATAKLDRKDKYPDTLAMPSGASAPADTRTAITYAQSQQAAFNIEGVPAYDNIFVIMEENKSTDAILGNARAPYINKLLSTYNQLTTYYSTGNPSEPNYTALGGADDWGITDDNWFGCGAVGANAPSDVAFPGGTASDGQLLPATSRIPAVAFYPQLATAGYTYGLTPVGGTATTKTVTYTDASMNAGFSTTAGNTCSTAPNPASPGTNHNAQGDNLFTLLSKAGLTARTYSESMNPGLDPRADSQAQHVAKAYTGTDVVGTNGTIADSQPYQLNQGLYKVKHGPSIAYQTARNLPEFYADNRTVFGSQFTASDWTSTSPFSTANGGTYDTTKWIYDQFGADLAAGDVGTINFVVPDQCDDMHGVGDGTETCNGGANSNNGQNPSITRADIYLQQVISKIQASPLWQNKNKRVAIVVMFDEGEGTAHGSSCCGWNAGGVNSGAAPVAVSASGVASATSAPVGYASGNNGHGNSIYAVISNQQDVGTAPKGIKDSDSYSHFAFVRTLQDMFQLADPTKDATYLNRAKYTEAFIAANIAALPEFAGSADTHFDAVRPINHAYKIPATYTQKLDPLGIVPVGAASGVTPQVGADANQTNVWSLK